VGSLLPNFFGQAWWAKVPGTILTTSHYTGIVLDRTLSRKDLLATLVHEMIHCHTPSYREATVLRLEEMFVSFLQSNPAAFRRLLPKSNARRRSRPQ